jgi:hypothetical protein
MMNPFGTPDASAPSANDHAATSNLDHDHEPPHQSDPLLKRPILSTVHFDQIPAPPSPSRSNTGSTMFAEPETRSNSEDGSREGSIDGLKRSRKGTRRKTRFSICHPPPESKVKQRLHRRPRSLLQLHRLQSNARPLPALEVIPSANFSVRLTRAITKVFKAKHGLCPSDLVVLKAEKYSREEEDEEQEARDVVGLICKGRKEDEKSSSGKMSIHLASGKTWDAYTTSNGAYECCAIDEHGLTSTVRWVPKRQKDGSKSAGKDGPRRFNFSTISPNSRRHPVIASLTKSGIEINDTYRIPESAAITPLGTPRLAPTTVDESLEEEIDGIQECKTDDELREIITITAIWVAFKEGWSPSFKYDEKREMDSRLMPNSPGRGVMSPVGTPPGSPDPVDKRASIRSFGSGVMRRASLLSRSNRSSIASVPEDFESPVPSRNGSVNNGQQKTGRARADSSSTVLVHRAASNRRKNNQMVAYRPDLNPSNDLQETSKEDLAREYNFEPGPKPGPSPLARLPASHPPEPDGTNEMDFAFETLPRSKSPSGKRLRESVATTETVGDIRHGHPVPIIKTKRGRKGWRKLLCGAGSID